MRFNSTDSRDDHTLQDEAYGYGFLMVTLISLVSLAGIGVVPFLKEGTRLGQYYKYIYALLISLGVSSLFCDAVLHLIPHAFNLHSHQEIEADEEEVMWRGCAVIGGALVTFLLEYVLHSLTAHGHGHSHGQLRISGHSTEEQKPIKSHQGSTSAVIPQGDASCKYFSEGGPAAVVHAKVAPCAECPEEGPVGFGGGGSQKEKSERCSYGTITFVSAQSTFSVESNRGVDNDETQLLGNDLTNKNTEHHNKMPVPLQSKMMCGFIRSIKPLAWVIIVGDGMHNLTDGIAIGVAISQSLGLGVSTALAILFHEIPHEIGDYVILLSTGMKWHIALLLNFLSALTAIVGFFVGVAIGTDSEEAQDWILAFTAGQFLYIALVDLLPELLHTKEKGCKKMGQFVMTITGLTVGFAILLVIAIYEEQLDSLVD